MKAGPPVGFGLGDKMSISSLTGAGDIPGRQDARPGTAQATRRTTAWNPDGPDGNLHRKTARVEQHLGRRLGT